MELKDVEIYYLNEREKNLVNEDNVKKEMMIILKLKLNRELTKKNKSLQLKRKINFIFLTPHTNNNISNLTVNMLFGKNIHK